MVEVQIDSATFNFFWRFSGPITLSGDPDFSQLQIADPDTPGNWLSPVDAPTQTAANELLVNYGTGTSSDWQANASPPGITEVVVVPATGAILPP